MKGTPLPWSRGGLFGIAVFSDGWGPPVCEVYSPHAEHDETALADAKLIVRAVNSHDDLVASIRELVDSAGNPSSEALARAAAVLAQVAAE